jgi:hypothetical protein
MNRPAVATIPNVHLDILIFIFPSSGSVGAENKSRGRLVTHLYKLSTLE